MTENNLTNKNGTAKLFPTRLCPLNFGRLTLIAASIATTKNITNTKQTLFCPLQPFHFCLRGFWYELLSSEKAVCEESRYDTRELNYMKKSLFSQFDFSDENQNVFLVTEKGDQQYYWMKAAFIHVLKSHEISDRTISVTLKRSVGALEIIHALMVIIFVVYRRL